MYSFCGKYTSVAVSTGDKIVPLYIYIHLYYSYIYIMIIYIFINISLFLSRPIHFLVEFWQILPKKCY